MLSKALLGFLSNQGFYEKMHALFGDKEVVKNIELSLICVWGVNEFCRCEYVITIKSYVTTIIKTLARALADGLITVVGRGGEANLLNFTMIPTLLIIVFSTLYTWVGYYTLY